MSSFLTRILALVLALGGAACGDDRGQDPAREVAVRAPKLAPVSKVESTDAWQDLIAQRPSAVVIREGRVWIDLGHPSAHKHLQLAAAGSPWRLAQDVDERRAALLVGHGGALDIPLDGPLSPALNPDTPYTPPPGEPMPEDPPPPTTGLAMAITLRALAPDQSVTVLWEERPLANLRVGEEWERRTLSLPNDLVVSGDNRLRLHFRNVAPLTPPGEAPLPAGPSADDPMLVSAAIESVEVGTLDTIRAGPPRATAGNDYEIRSLGDEVEFEVPANRSLVYYLIPPRRARLRVELSGRGSLEVLASTDADHRLGRAPAELLQQPLRAAGGSASVDLSGYGEIPTRLEIRVRSTRGPEPGQGSGQPAEGPPGGALFEALDIVAHRSMPVDRRDRSPRDVYVLALEGVRPDDLFDGALGAIPKSPSYPSVARFLADALVFERAYALGAAAVPSHAGLLTSVVPPGHLTVRGTFVAEGQSTLAEILDRAGYFNSGVSANSYISNERGLTQGFADHKILVRSNTRGNDAQKVVLAMLDEIAQRPSPRFIYAVLNDAQAPYDPPSEVLADVTPPEDAPAQHRTHMWVGRVRTQKIEPDRAQLEYVRRLYRGELQVIDQALGLLLDSLAEREELDEAVIVLVGVHGEEFLEHGSAGHGRTLYEESIHVPLAIRAPKLLAPGRVEAPIDLLDLAPTLTDLLGVEYAPRWQGESLVPLIDDPQPPPRLVVSYLGDGSRAAIVGEYKFVLGPGRGRESQHFFNLAADPGELSDQIENGGVALRMVRTALAWELPEQPQWSRARWGTGADLEPAFALDHGL
ncbi:sulfatase [Enhygromyxa salina]|uniref:sulfatase n=1 Tax=Enhygromyxa salina TaxID=215803 RepID=UPI000D09559C|nr:sulfatase [Enhygromyxa salina]